MTIQSKNNVLKRSTTYKGKFNREPIGFDMLVDEFGDEYRDEAGEEYVVSED